MVKWLVSFSRRMAEDRQRAGQRLRFASASRPSAATNGAELPPAPAPGYGDRLPIAVRLKGGLHVVDQ